MWEISPSSTGTKEEIRKRGLWETRTHAKQVNTSHCVISLSRDSSRCLSNSETLRQKPRLKHCKQLQTPPARLQYMAHKLQLNESEMQDLCRNYCSAKITETIRQIHIMICPADKQHSQARSTNNSFDLKRSIVHKTISIMTQ